MLRVVGHEGESAKLGNGSEKRLRLMGYGYALFPSKARATYLGDQKDLYLRDRTYSYPISREATQLGV